MYWWSTKPVTPSRTARWNWPHWVPALLLQQELFINIICLLLYLCLSIFFICFCICSFLLYVNVLEFKTELLLLRWPEAGGEAVSSHSRASWLCQHQSQCESGFHRKRHHLWEYRWGSIYCIKTGSDLLYPEVFSSLVCVCVAVYDVSGAASDRNCVVLSDIHIDIMDYIQPASCTDAEFRQMWAEFEWENKVNNCTCCEILCDVNISLVCFLFLVL